jgi:leucyl-tRNA synthetase
MGMGLLEGEKMSSSKGHVVLPGEAIETYGADTVRFFLLNSAEPWQDYDWRAGQVESVRDQLDRFWNRAAELIPEESRSRLAADPEGRELADVDHWLLSKLQDTVREVTEALEGAETRTASQAAFYGFEEALRWYRRRTDRSRPGAPWTLRYALEAPLRLLAPFVPFMANELHEELTGTPAEDAPWPAVATDLERPAVEARERQIERLTEDVSDILDVTGTDPDRIRVYVAADWKRDVFETVAEVGTDVGRVMSEAMSDPDLRERGDEVNDLVEDLVGLVRSVDDVDALLETDEAAVYAEATPFLEREFDAEVSVYAEDDDPPDPGDRAGTAVPFRPAIHVE